MYVKHLPPISQQVFPSPYSPDHYSFLCPVSVRLHQHTYECMYLQVPGPISEEINVFFGNWFLLNKYLINILCKYLLLGASSHCVDVK